MKILCLLSVSILLCAQTPLPFDTLAEPLKNDSTKLAHLNEIYLEADEPRIVENFCSDVQHTLSLGEEIASKPDAEVLNNYLIKLRSLSKRQEEIHWLYQKSLLNAIVANDKQKFAHLATIELEPLHQPRVRSEAIAFYQKNFSGQPIKTLDSLCKEEAIEAKSIQFAIEQEKAYEEHLKTLNRADASKIKRGVTIGSRNSVIVVEEMGKNGEIIFEAENLNPFMVTLALDFDTLDNLKADKSLPLYVELAGKSKKEIVRLAPITLNGRTNHVASYGWVKGSAFAQHDDNYIYALPFTKGSTVRVSQGYNGGFSHKGLSAYAVDFSLPIGTPVYAAREGEVVGIDVSSNYGGASPAYRAYMNYVNIRHSDGTLGNYYHLKYGGTVVKIGDKVTKGQLIAYSGNTGYTTAPHLHFSVSKVDPVSMRRPMNLPIKMQTLQGIVTNPHEGEYYTVQ
ncbi:MAG: M23 family metallopeptidase [Sulfuricurvum sp.]|uniref:M23 family metallopeptidase n=1 Tax=Sulfuricurvum sp. TaxID=2025608 RepID=UPI0026017070|nr:M23 family metallopeptidase [Sulfuricurvum sp.]MDD2828563.1 M23 family metallopeptidase [Sulfuricurvum sp.]MDD4948906.1 M23 family metallopeptidase [Sulfuricurvum sp.]